MRSYRIHEFAELAGVTVKALHHYDRLGLLKPRRTDSGYRLYDERDLERLEQIVHPMLRVHHQEFLEEAERSGAPVAVVDVPLLFETGGEQRVDAVVVVTTSPEIQRQRILARDNMSAEKLDAILARQLPDAEKRKRADFIVDTSHGLDPVRARIRDILNEAAKLPRRRS